MGCIGDWWLWFDEYWIVGDNEDVWMLDDVYDCLMKNNCDWVGWLKMMDFVDVFWLLMCECVMTKSRKKNREEKEGRKHLNMWFVL